MTTEQMDEKDSRYNYVGVTAQSLVDGAAERRKAAAARGPVVLYGEPSKEEIAAARGRAGGRGVMIVPEELRNLEHPGFEDDGLESHEWTGEPQHPESKRLEWKAVADSCDQVIRATLEALGFEADTDPVLAARKRMRQLEEVKAGARDDDPERTYNDETTMAEEPIEDRLRRAWLNGFRDGVERASYATTESTGRWDY